MIDFGQILETARRAEGLTQVQLAERSGVTQVAIHRYEKGLREPSPEVVERLATALGLTPRLLDKAGRLVGAVAVDAHMRRRQSAPATAWRRLEARLNLLRWHSSLLYEEISLESDAAVPRFDLAEVSPQDAARMTRMQWHMPVGPVDHLVGWLENAGCLVIQEDFGTTRVDGLSQWVADHPLILVNSRVPIDRMRWTLSHELGHLSLHEQSSPTVESDANQFASEFLMPAHVIRSQLRTVSLGKLIDLKREWGVSVQALIERAHSLKLITDSKRTGLYRDLGARGWRVREPASDELRPEISSLGAKIAGALSRDGLSEREIAQAAGWSEPDRNAIFVETPPGLRVVR